jgi:DNA-binding beta-propeller fold protein YncE
MKKLTRFLPLFVFAILMGILSIHLSGCADSGPTAPVTRDFNAMTAFVTIGSSTEFNSPGQVVYVSGNLWVADSVNNNLQQWTTAGVQLQAISTFNSGDTFNGPWGVAREAKTGDIYVGDKSNDRIVVFDSAGAYQTTFGNTQLTGEGGNAVEVSSNSTTVYAVGENPGTVYLYTIGGVNPLHTYTYRSSFGQTGSGVSILDDVQDLVMAPNHYLYIADLGKSRIAIFSPLGTYANQYTCADLVAPKSVAIDLVGYILSADATNHWVVVFNTGGAEVGKFGGSVLVNPTGIATDGNGNYYVADAGTKSIIGFHQ